MIKQRTEVIKYSAHGQIKCLCSLIIKYSISIKVFLLMTETAFNQYLYFCCFSSTTAFFEFM